MMAALYMSVYKKAKSENLKKKSAFKISDSEPKSSSEYFYLKAKEFQHFQYILHLTRDCTFEKDTKEHRSNEPCAASKCLY